MIKIIYIICFLLIFSFLNINSVFADSCKYTGKIEQCVAANKSGSPKSIEDFVCLTSKSREKIAYQIILDMEFKKVDEDMDKYLETLEKSKNTYFGVGAEKNYIDGINDIHTKGDELKQEYYNLCGITIVQQSIACSGDNSTTIYNAKDFFTTGDSLCAVLVDKKIEILKDVAFNVLMLNKVQIKADEKKTYDQGQRKNYDHLLEIMMINIGYVERIWQKWPSKLKNPHN